MSFKFPKNFYWGASTSAHQVEGGNHNDWAGFEKQVAKRQAQNATRQSWPDYILKNYPNPLQEENYISGRACDHYNRFPEDFDLAQKIGLNAYRFSIEWSRIEPEEGKFNPKEIEHYREVIKALRERGIEPFVTLWHWTLPMWVEKQRGWINRKTVSDFVRFSGKIGEEFKDDVKFFTTLNEPGSWAADAYLYGNKPPARRNFFLLNRVYWNLHRTHCQTYLKLKTINKNFSIGIAESMEWYGRGPIFSIASYFRNFFFLHTIIDKLDFVGINYYKRLKFFGKRGEASDMGWEIYPEGLLRLLKKSSRLFKKPIFITENGIADARDEKRAKFIEDHLAVVSRALSEGIDIRGYFHWSLLDNFEWEHGFWPRFGLLEVDYKTMERRIIQSAWEYARIIKENAVGL